MVWFRGQRPVIEGDHHKEIDIQSMYNTDMYTCTCAHAGHRTHARTQCNQHMHTCTDAQTDTSTHARTHSRTHARMHARTHARTLRIPVRPESESSYTASTVCVCVCVRACACASACAHACVRGSKRLILLWCAPETAASNSKHVDIRSQSLRVLYARTHLGASCTHART